MSGTLGSSVLAIILIEDDEVDAMAVRRAVHTLTHPPELQIYPSADRALSDERLAIGTEGPPPLIILDLNLPGLSGLAFLQQLRTNKAYRSDVPVVVLTTSADHRDRAAALRLHAAGYFIKPVDGTTLRDLVDILVTYWARSLGIDQP